MVKKKINKIQKRDGRVVDFDQEKITKVILKAIHAVGRGNGDLSKKASSKVVQILNKKMKPGEIPTVEQVQDVVEEVLITLDLIKTAKAYILYRDQRRKIRETKREKENAIQRIDEYLERSNWKVNENANIVYSLQGLSQYVVSEASKNYWLNKIYTPEIREAQEKGDFHIHKMQTLSSYCGGWDLYDLLLKGFGGASGKVQAKPAKHFGAALGQITNFMYALQLESPEGAVAFSNFDTLLAPLVRNDNLSYSEVKQNIQHFLFDCNIPTRGGLQSFFSNITFDIVPSPVFADQPIIIGGKPRKQTYSEFQKEIDMIVKAFYEVILEGDALGRVFTYPIPTINITKDFPWEKESLEPMWEATAKYGINYFGNYINSDMKPEDVRSMCCRLRLELNSLHNRGGGGLFGAGSLTGSIGITTINMSRIGYLSKNEQDFFERLERIMDIAKTGLEIKRKSVERFTEEGFYPYSKHWLSEVKKVKGGYWSNHFSTIGLIGMNEALLNFMKKDIASKQGKEFALKVLDFMRDKLLQYQEETGNMYNLEASPAEGTSFHLALVDKKAYPDIITAGTKEVPYYTNSTQLPVSYTDDVFEAVELQDELQCKYTGGSVTHLFLGERLRDANQAKKLVRKVFERFKLPYISLTPTFSICSSHGYLQGEHFECPKCKQSCEVYSRVVGYYRPVQQFNIGKKQEFSERKEFRV